MSKRGGEIPAELRPDPARFDFDLQRALDAVVLLRATVPGDAFTAGALGTERAGSAVMIGDGLLLTIGYLVTEAESIWLTANDGRTVPGHALGFDQGTGFGLVQVLGKLNLPVLEFGESAALRAGSAAVLAAGGGIPASVATKVAARQEFAGYWEYLIDEAIFTSPAHPFWGGAALIGPDGKLAGIGSLIMQQGDERGASRDLNMVVPIDLLPPVLDDLRRFGRVNRPARPWLGLYATSDEDSLVVGGLADDGPAEQAGLRTGDRIVAVDDQPVAELADLWRAIWALGDAGCAVPLHIARGERESVVTVASADRNAFLKAPRLH